MNVVLLEGNIGCGKSTFLQKVSESRSMFKDKNIHVINEPVKLWTNSQEGDLLSSANTGHISSSLFQVKFLFGICIVFETLI